MDRIRDEVRKPKTPSDSLATRGLEWARGEDLPPIEVFDRVVIVEGALQGITGEVIKSDGAGHIVVSLCEQNAQAWAKFPARLLRKA
jgi:hypothetical protein